MIESGIQSLPLVGNPEDRELCLLLPQYKSTHPLTLFSLMAVWDRRRMMAAMHFNDALIVHSRNSLATKFVNETKCEWSLWVDDDMVIPTGNTDWMEKVAGVQQPAGVAPQNGVDMLLSRKKTIIGGLYFTRALRGEGSPCFAQAFRNKEAAGRVRKRQQGWTGPVATDWVGTGFLLVHRSVYVDIQTKYPHLAPEAPGKPWRFFSPSNDRNAETLRRLAAAKPEELEGIMAGWKENAGNANAFSGEDVVFCRRAKSVGHQPWVDTDCLCGHVGATVWTNTNTA